MTLLGATNITIPRAFLLPATTTTQFFNTLNIQEPRFLTFSNNLRTNTITTSPLASSSSTYSSSTGPDIFPNWTLDSWKSKKAHQLPDYPDSEELNSVLTTIESFPPIVFAGEARRLEEWLGKAAMGQAFLLQGGDCAESFEEFNANNIRDTFRIFLQMAITLIYGAQMPVIKVLPLALTNILFERLCLLGISKNCPFFAWCLTY